MTHNFRTSDEMLDKMTSSSFQLFSHLIKKNHEENLAFSPASLHLAMGLAYIGARGETSMEMSRVMGFDTSTGNFNELMSSYYNTFSEIGNDTAIVFALGNRVFTEKTFSIDPLFVHDINKWDGGAFEVVDFIRHTREAELHINNWVAQNTGNRIQNLIAPGSLSDLTRIVLVNALYLKSDWKYPFRKENTSDKPFFNHDGSQNIKKFMTGSEKRIPWFSSSDFTAIELPYTSPLISMIIILPEKKSKNSDKLKVPTANEYSSILKGLSEQNVYMEIPLFRLETSLSLSEVLKSAGIMKAFERDADFSGITEKEDLYISAVVQKVFIEVDEAGSEAAAATGIVMGTTSMPIDPPQPREFIANRPFLLILKENQFSTPLFIGQIVK